MSRYEITLPEPKNGITQVAYGHDAACGYFFQGYDNPDEDPKIDTDSLFSGLTGVRLVEMLDKFDVPVPAMHRTSMMLDLQF